MQNFDFTLNLLLFDRLENFNDAFGVVPDVDSLEYLRVFASADFADDFIALLVAPVDGEGLVVPVVAGAVDVDVCVDSVNILRRGAKIRYDGEDTINPKQQNNSMKYDGHAKELILTWLGS